MIRYFYFPEIDSTNNELKRRLQGEHTSPEEYTVISAGMQTAGRGRSGHDWVSRPDVSVSTSMVIYPKGLDGEQLARITLLAAVSVCRAVEDETGLAPGIKWVNDVLLGNKKICGILSERIPESGAVIVGIGVNVRRGSYPESLTNMATSLEEQLGNCHRVSRRKLTEKIWKYFVEYYEAYLEDRDLSGVIRDYNHRLINRGREVTVLDPAGRYTALARGVDESGRLLVELPDGEVRVIDSGEVSVRGIYGYGV